MESILTAICSSGSAATFDGVDAVSTALASTGCRDTEKLVALLGVAEAPRVVDAEVIVLETTSVPAVADDVVVDATAAVMACDWPGSIVSDPSRRVIS